MDFTTVYNYINEFSADQQPLVHTYSYELPIVSVTLYLLMVFLGPKFMKSKKEAKIWAVILPYWNLFLSIASLVMFVGIAPLCVLYILEFGFLKFLCLPDGQLYKGPQMFCIYLFAMSKYVELIDTFFLVVRKKEVEFLHYFHHTTVLLYTWFCMIVLPGGVGYVFGTFNTAIHTMMYYYYYRSSFKRQSWGVIVTTLQLSQMAVGVLMGVSWSVVFLTTGYCNCSVPYIFILSSVSLYGSYLYLFLNFYRKKYNSKPATKPEAKPKPSTTAKAE